MAEKGPPKSWKSHDFPERFKTTSGTNFAKTEKQKWIWSFWGCSGRLMGTKKSFWGVWSKCQHFCHELDQPFWVHFRWKVDEKIDAKINTEKVMKIDEISMRKWSRIWILSEGAVREKTYFPEKADVRYTLAGCSRMRVGEGSSEKKKVGKVIKKNF